MPDLDRSPRASFISSNEGDTPCSFSRLLMNSSSSYCFLVSMFDFPHPAVVRPPPTTARNKYATRAHVLVWFLRNVKWFVDKSEQSTSRGIGNRFCADPVVWAFLRD